MAGLVLACPGQPRSAASKTRPTSPKMDPHRGRTRPQRSLRRRGFVSIQPHYWAILFIFPPILPTSTALTIAWAADRKRVEICLDGRMTTAPEAREASQKRDWAASIRLQGLERRPPASCTRAATTRKTDPAGTGNRVFVAFFSNHGSSRRPRKSCATQQNFRNA